MANVIIVYESKYGNTKIVAETIAEGMGQVSENKITLRELKDVNTKHLVDFDLILIGSPNHMGGPTGGIKKFISNLGKLDLKEKHAAAFDTYMAGDYEKAVKKMERQINEKVPELRLLTPGISIRVEGMKGQITEGELPKCRDFGIRIASQIDKQT